ncbi:hypothetical protein LBMAG42_11730 [Deltaproteobacteria bacterium]|nr:hypothetical protein LBMAG42_11730 [Deltaproteobacteria bacterium]
MLFFVAIAGATSPTPADAQVHDQLLALVERSTELGCLTPLVGQIRLNAALFSATERAHISATLSPAGVDLFDEAPVMPAAPPAAAPPPARDSCWSWSDNRVVGDHFVVEWADGVDDADADRFLEDLEYSWQIEVEEKNWDAPDGADNYLIVAYIQNERTGGAYTTVKSCGGDYIPYIVSGKDSWDDPKWGATMAAHEFNHAIQFGYSYAPEFWWWEATATWVEDYVFPDTNDWSDYVWGYSANPYIAFAASDQQDQEIFWHMYGMAIWAFYLDDYQGGHDTVQQTWEDARSDRGQYSRSAEDMVDDLGLDWLTLYNDFVARNTVMEYKQQSYFPAVDVHDTVKSLPDDGGSGNSDTPQGYGQNYVKFNEGMGEGDLVLHFAGSDKTEWSVQLVETSKYAVTRVVTAKTEDGAADVTLTGYGKQDVYLVVSPLTERDDDFDYEWTAELIEVEEPEDTGTPSIDDTGAGGDPVGGGPVEISGPVACGCAATEPGAAAAGAAVIAALIAGRRRSTP